jgi:protein-S-isoprenylcysteine O-methyltransferase Ste14
MPRTLNLIVRNVMFTIVVPGLGGVLAPWRKPSRQFGDSYLEYRRTVPRWIPRRPRHS